MKFLGNWSDVEDVVNDFQINSKELDGAVIHVAWYGYGDYDGSAFVLFERDGQLYEVNSGHCSCYGLENTWDPEETTVEALLHRINEGNAFCYADNAQDCAKAVLEFCNSRREA